MSNDPSDVVDKVQKAEEAFSAFSQDRELEEGLDTDNEVKTQHRKACRLLKACKVLRENNGYHTSVIEMSFAAIERSLEWYVLDKSNEEVGNFQNHRYAYDRVAELGLLSESLCDRLYMLYRENRSASYYRNTVATKEQSDKMFNLAVSIHDFIGDHLRSNQDCICDL